MSVDETLARHFARVVTERNEAVALLKRAQAALPVLIVALEVNDLAGTDIARDLLKDITDYRYSD